MQQIQTVAVIGAGITGRTIAHTAATAGYRTILEDILPASLRKAENEIRDAFDRSIDLGRISRADADAAYSRVEFASSVEDAARRADLVVESVPEEMESKIEIFTLLDKICKPDTILVCSTPFLSVTDIASATYRAGKIIGMRFFNSEHGVQMLELVRARETDDETIAACTEVGRRMGREVVVIRECSGLWRAEAISDP